MEFIEDNTRQQFFRFYELVDLYNKADGRRQLTFDDKGYVEDIDLYISGILSFLHIDFYIDGSSLDWKLINCTKRFKTMLDFYNGKITCHGKFIDELEGYMRYNFKNAKIRSTVINPGANNKDRITEFFKL